MIINRYIADDEAIQNGESVLSKRLLDYLSKCGISKATAEKWNVKQFLYDGKPVIEYSHLDEEGLFKYHSYYCPKDGVKDSHVEHMGILLGVWHIDTEKPVILTQDNLSAMVLYELGHKNVVSCEGVSIDNWIRNSYEWLLTIKQLIVFANTTDDGIRQAEEVARKFKDVQIIFHRLYRNAFQAFKKSGKESVESVLKQVNNLPKGLKDLSSVDYVTGEQRIKESIETGFKDYDEHVEDWKMGELTIVLGRNGEGKSTFLSQVITHQILRNVNTFLYSGELSDDKIQNWLYDQLIGNDTIYKRSYKTKYKTKYEPTREAIQAIKKWHSEKLFVFDKKETEIMRDIDKFFDVMELAARKFNVKLFVIDNLMALLEEKANSLNSDQANLTQRCKNFAVRNNCHVVLVTHPNKEKKEIKDPNNQVGNLEKGDVSGTNNIPNKADNFITVERNWVEGEQRLFDCLITSQKDREDGIRKSFEYLFGGNTRRYYNDSTANNVDYGWKDYLSDDIDRTTGKKINLETPVIEDWRAGQF